MCLGLPALQHGAKIGSGEASETSRRRLRKASYFTPHLGTHKKPKRGPKRGPRGAQEEPKRAPKRSPREAHNTTPKPEGSRTPPGTLRDPPRDPHEAPKRGPRGPTTAQERTREGPKEVEEGSWRGLPRLWPRSSLATLRVLPPRPNSGPTGAQGRPQERCKRRPDTGLPSKGTPRGPQEGPRTRRAQERTQEGLRGALKRSWRGLRGLWFGVLSRLSVRGPKRGNFLDIGCATWSKGG